MSQKIVQNTQSDKCRCLDTMMFCSWFLEIRAYANRQHAISHRFERLRLRPPISPPFCSLSPAVTIDCTSVVYASIGYIGWYADSKIVLGLSERDGRLGRENLGGYPNFG